MRQPSSEWGLMAGSKKKGVTFRIIAKYPAPFIAFHIAMFVYVTRRSELNVTCHKARFVIAQLKDIH